MIDGSPGQMAFLVVAGLLAGAVNAVAGGGSLIVFPALLAIGFPPLAANVTNSVAQWPGFLGASFGQRMELRGQRSRVLSASTVAVLGAGAGCLLLLVLPDAVFDAVVPALVLLASALLAAQPRIRRATGDPAPGAPDNRQTLLITVFFASIYGGYFGGALGVILLAALALCANDTLVRLNAAKAVVSLVVATVTVLIFALAAPVNWLAVAMIAPSTLLGGYLGARLARRLPEAVLRWSVVTLGVGVAVYLMVR